MIRVNLETCDELRSGMPESGQKLFMSPQQSGAYGFIDKVTFAFISSLHCTSRILNSHLVSEFTDLITNSPTYNSGTCNSGTYNSRTYNGTEPPIPEVRIRTSQGTGSSGPLVSRMRRTQVFHAPSHPTRPPFSSLKVV